MKYKQIVQELRESKDLNVQIFLNDVDKITKLSQKEKKSLLTKLQNPGVIDTLVKNYIPLSRTTFPRSSGSLMRTVC